MVLASTFFFFFAIFCFIVGRQQGFGTCPYPSPPPPLHDLEGQDTRHCAR